MSPVKEYFYCRLCLDALPTVLCNTSIRTAVETIGSEFMAVSGLPSQLKHHPNTAYAALVTAIDMLHAIRQVSCLFFLPSCLSYHAILCPDLRSGRSNWPPRGPHARFVFSLASNRHQFWLGRGSYSGQAVTAEIQALW